MILKMLKFKFKEAFEVDALGNFKNANGFDFIFILTVCFMLVGLIERM